MSDIPAVTLGTIADNLGFRLLSQFRTLEAERRDLELIWADSLRQYRGVYDPEVKKKIIDNDGNMVYPKITRMKVLTAAAKINEIVFPDVDKNWDIRPDPAQSVSKAELVNIIKDKIQKGEFKQDQKPTSEEIQ